MHPHLETLVKRYPDLGPCLEDIQRAVLLLEQTFRSGGKLLICGNGGSASDSEHIVGELMKGFLLPRPVPSTLQQALSEAFPTEGTYLAEHLQGALPAIPLTNNSALASATTNDMAADMVFAQQVYGYGKAGDVVMGISTSGNSRNVCQALRVGRVLGLRTLGLTGPRGGAFPALCNVTICAPGAGVAQIQERHLPIYHTICTMLEETFFHAA